MVVVMLLLSILTWPAHLIVSAVLWLAGWPICTWLTLRSDVEERLVSRFERTLLKWRAPWAYIFGNDEDGIDGLRGGSPDQYAWAEQTKNDSAAWRILKWSCWRNPIGNLRFVRPFGFQIIPSKVNWIGNTADPDRDYEWRPDTYWYFAWHGLYTGAWIIYRGYQLRIGWKILPCDAVGVSPEDYRSKGCGFALQLQRK
jgi:hypothetical protein